MTTRRGGLPGRGSASDASLPKVDAGGVGVPRLTGHSVFIFNRKMSLVSRIPKPDLKRKEKRKKEKKKKRPAASPGYGLDRVVPGLDRVVPGLDV